MSNKEFDVSIWKRTNFAPNVERQDFGRRRIPDKGESQNPELQNTAYKLKRTPESSAGGTHMMSEYSRRRPPINVRIEEEKKAAIQRERLMKSQTVGSTIDEEKLLKERGTRGLMSLDCYNTKSFVSSVSERSLQRQKAMDATKKRVEESKKQPRKVLKRGRYRSA